MIAQDTGVVSRESSVERVKKRISVENVMSTRKKSVSKYASWRRLINETEYLPNYDGFRTQFNVRQFLIFMLELKILRAR